MSTLFAPYFRIIMPREVPTGNLPVLSIRCARSAGLGAVKLLRIFANAHLREAEPQRLDSRPVSVVVKAF